MQKTVAIVCGQRIKSRKGEVIGTREVVNEINDDGLNIESVTRVIVKMADGRILVDKVVQKGIYPSSNNVRGINLLNGKIA